MTHLCGRVRDQLSAYEEGQMTREEAAEIAAHLMTCAPCRSEASSQSAVRTRLRRYREVMQPATPPDSLYRNAKSAWDAQDRLQRRRMGLRFALAGSSLFILTLGTVWARLQTLREFPIVYALQDYAKTKPVHPAFPTHDPDAAANWLRPRLHRDFPPINLSLSRAQLVGADFFKTAQGEMGRLTYLSPQGRIALYLAPGKTAFEGTRKMERLERQFFVRRDKNSNGFFGWNEGSMGYGLVTAQPSHEGILLNAKRATEGR